MKKKEATAITPAARSSFISHHSSLITAFFLGAVTVAGFAPFHLFPLPVLALAALFALWHRAANARRAAWIGFGYGLGLFLFGVSWVYVSLHDFGAMPAPLAGLATLLFCAFLALLPAAAGYAGFRFHAPDGARLGLLVPAVWTLTEWIRGWLLTGFPWLALGYSQVPLSPLAGYTPVLGIYGVTLATAVTAGLIVILWQRATARDEGGGLRAEGKSETPGKSHSSSAILRVILHPSSFILLAIWLGGWGLSQIAWTSPVGAPVSVSLLQGNVAQDLKWREERVRPTLEAYSSPWEWTTPRLSKRSRW